LTSEGLKKTRDKTENSATSKKRSMKKGDRKSKRGYEEREKISLFDEIEVKETELMGKSEERQQKRYITSETR